MKQVLLWYTIWKGLDIPSLPNSRSLLKALHLNSYLKTFISLDEDFAT